MNVSITTSHRRRPAVPTDPVDSRWSAGVLMVWAALIMAAAVLLVLL